MGFLSTQAIVVGLTILGTATVALPHDGKLYVRNTGRDSAHCGDAQNACRSISQAIENASSEDTILVGPGRYGDLNGDNDFNDPGEEHLQSDGYTSCVICIRKSVHLYSLFGADVTFVDGPSNPQGPIAVVRVFANGVIVGSKDHGFTFRHGDRALVADNGLDYVRVIGNVASQFGYAGFSFTSPGRYLVISYNRAIGGGGTAFLVYAGADNPLIYRNVADGNGYAGFQVFSPSAQVLENVASHNFIGFQVGRRTLLKDNSVISNHVGINLPGDDAAVPAAQRIVGNTIVGNDYAGFEIVAASQNVTITGNNIYGNGVNGINTAAGSASGCGIVDFAGPLVNATNNFWGVASGPGTDSANKAGPGSGCDLGGGRTQVQPFATAPFLLAPVTAPWR